MKKLSLLAFLLSLAFLIPTVVIAQNSNSGIIKGCIMPVTGFLRIVSGNEKCLKKEKTLSWNSIVPAPTPTASPEPEDDGNVSGVFTISGNISENPLCYSPAGINSPCSEETHVPLPLDGELVSFVVRPFSNSASTDGSMVRVLVNGITKIEVNILSGSTETQIINTNIPVNAGDVFAIQSEDTLGTGTVSFTASLAYKAN